MLDNEPTGVSSADTTSDEQTAATTSRRRTTRRAPKAAPVDGTETAAATDPVVPADSPDGAPAAEAAPAPVKRARRAAKKAAPVPAPDPTAAAVAAVAEGPETADPAGGAAPAAKAARKAAPRKRAAKKAAEPAEAPAAEAPVADAAETPAPAKRTRRGAKKAAPVAEVPADVATEDEEDEAGTAAPAPAAPAALFVAPDPTAAAPRKRGARRPAGPPEPIEAPVAGEPAEDTTADVEAEDADSDSETGDRRRRRRGRRGRGRGKGGEEGSADEDETATAPADEAETAEGEHGEDEDGDEEGGSRRRTRRRRRRGAGGDADADEPAPKAARTAVDEVQGVKGSTRLEAKRQRRRDGRDQGRRRPPVLSEAEFLARREAVERTMVVRQVGDRTQIAVLEDDVLVEHYVTKASNASYAGNVYLGKVQNVLPSMEAAFVDIGKGRNAVLYAGEVNWDAAGMEGKPRKIEQALRSGDPVLAQVTKDPIGHKGARLTSQVSLPGRFLVYVPEGQMTGISRKLPDTERKRLKDILKKIVPENAGVIIRTAAEGASEEELTRDVARLEAQWQTIKAKAEKGQAP
ncbi:MAG TPA: ribonuclease E/G, partial [Mycobacteriales bacterium]